MNKSSRILNYNCFNSPLADMMIWMYQTQWTYMEFTIPLPTFWLLRVGRNIEGTSSRKRVSRVQFLGSMPVWRRLMEALRLERSRHFFQFCMSTSIGKSSGLFQRKGDGIRTLWWAYLVWGEALLLDFWCGFAEIFIFYMLCCGSTKPSGFRYLEIFG